MERSGEQGGDRWMVVWWNSGGGMVWEGRVSWGGFGCVDRWWALTPFLLKVELGWE